MGIKPEDRGLFKSGDYVLEKNPNGGRPKVAITHEQLKSVCRLNPTKADVAAFFDCSMNTIELRCKEFEGLSFSEFRDKYMAHTRLHLVRRALKMAENNTAMMIFCLKNLCKWVDKVDIESKSTVEVLDPAIKEIQNMDEVERKSRLNKLKKLVDSGENIVDVEKK